MEVLETLSKTGFQIGSISILSIGQCPIIIVAKYGGVGEPVRDRIFLLEDPVQMVVQTHFK